MAIDWDALVLSPVHGVFGGVAVIRHAAGAVTELADAVFDEAYTAVFEKDGEEISTICPRLGVREAALASPAKQGDRVEVGGKAYLVRDVRPDGHGEVGLLLNFKAPL